MSDLLPSVPLWARWVPWLLPLGVWSLVLWLGRRVIVAGVGAAFLALLAYGVLPRPVRRVVGWGVKGGVAILNQRRERRRSHDA